MTSRRLVKGSIWSTFAKGKLTHSSILEVPKVKLSIGLLFLAIRIKRWAKSLLTHTFMHIVVMCVPTERECLVVVRRPQSIKSHFVEYFQASPWVRSHPRPKN